MRVVDHVTRPQFEACLARLGLEASNEDLDILIRKFSDKPDGYVNYVAFTRTIDPYESCSDRHPDGKLEQARISPLYLPHISPTSPPHLPYISRLSPLQARAGARARGQRRLLAHQDE